MKTTYLLATLLLLTAIAAGAWYLYQRHEHELDAAALAHLPSIDLDESHPEVATVIRDSLSQIEESPRSAPAWGQLAMILMAHDLPAEAQHKFRQAVELDSAEFLWVYFLGIS